MTGSDFSCSMVRTPRLAMNVWTSGPEDGRPVLLIHGNLTTGGFWKYVAELLPDDVRVIAPDMRSFGMTERVGIDATRGLGDMVDDVHGLLETLGLSGTRSVVAAGWSMGGGVLEQYLTTYEGDLGAVVLVAPLSPFGFGGTKGADGQPCSDDFAGTGGGTAAPEFVKLLAAGDTSSDGPNSPRVVLRAFFGAGDNASNVDEDFLVAESLTTVVGDDFYPGTTTTSDNWPSVAPGDSGVLNAMSPKYFNASGLADIEVKPPITWLRAVKDQVVADGSMFDFAMLGQIGAVPGWPGEDVLPPQPMHVQTRAVLDRYAANGGEVREVTLEDVAHGVPLERPQAVADAIVAHLRG